MSESENGRPTTGPTANNEPAEGVPAPSQSTPGGKETARSPAGAGAAPPARPRIGDTRPAPTLGRQGVEARTAGCQGGARRAHGDVGPRAGRRPAPRRERAPRRS